MPRAETLICPRCGSHTVVDKLVNYSHARNTLVAPRLDEDDDLSPQGEEVCQRCMDQYGIWWRMPAAYAEAAQNLGDPEDATDAAEPTPEAVDAVVERMVDGIFDLLLSSLKKVTG